MSEAHHRRKNRLRVAAGISENPATPSFTGPEVLFLNKLRSVSSENGRTEYEGGWRNDRVGIRVGKGVS